MNRIKLLLVPALIFIVLSLGSFAIYTALREQDRHYMSALFDEEGNKARVIIKALCEQKINSIARVARRWEAAGGTPENLWRSDAAIIIKDLQGLKAIEWIDSSFHVRWAEPLAENKKAIGLDILLNPERRALVETAAQTFATTVTPPLDLVQGYKAFIAYEPLQVNGRFDGFIAGIFTIDDLLGPTFQKEFGANYVSTIVLGGQAFIETKQTAALAPEWQVEKSYSLYDQPWTIKLVPTLDYVNSKMSTTPLFALIAGLIISLLSAASAWLVSVSKVRANELEKTTAFIREKTNELAISEGRYNLVVKGMSVGLWDWDLKTDTLYWSERFNEMLGISDPDFQPNYELFSELVHPADVGAMETMLKAHMQKKGPYNIEYRIKRKDGTYVWVHASGQAHWDDDGILIRMAGSVVDVTARKNAEQQKQEQMEQTESIAGMLEESINEIYIVDAESLHFVQVNRGARNNLGYSLKELQDMTPADIKPEYTLQMFRNKVDVLRTAPTGKITFNARHERKDGTFYDVEVHMQMAKYAGRDVFFQIILDITERKQMERIKSEFISTVSHELRTPLTSIRGSLGLMVGTMSEAFPDKAKRLIDIAHKNSERLILLINDMLDIEKIASGQMRFDMKNESLLELIEQAVETNQPYAERLTVKIVTDPVPADITITVDQQRLLQILANLLSNAAKFSNPGGVVKVRVEMKGPVVRICVDDNGQGIADEFRDRIFTKFSQADSSATRSKGGTGLGLSISKEIAEYMGGTVGFKSKEGKGSTFWAEFPVTKTHVMPLRSDDENDDVPLLLHVEDDSDLSTILATALQGKAEVITSTTLKQAQRLLQTMDFSMIILDITLVDGSGLTLLDEIDNADGVKPPVVILSAAEMPQSVSDRVAAAMVKSRLSETRIVDKILSILLQTKMMKEQDEQNLEARSVR